MAFFSKDRKILFPDISYSFYPVYAQLLDLNYELVKLDENFNVSLEEFKKENGGVIIPNPNAPTAKYIHIEELKKLGADDITIVVGGVIPQQDYEFLYQNGADHIFGPGTNLPKSACEILEKMLD